MQKNFIAEPNWFLNFNWSLRSTVSFEWWNYLVTFERSQSKWKSMHANFSILSFGYFIEQPVTIRLISWLIQALIAFKVSNWTIWHKKLKYKSCSFFQRNIQHRARLKGTAFQCFAALRPFFSPKGPSIFLQQMQLVQYAASSIKSFPGNLPLTF